LICYPVEKIWPVARNEQLPVPQLPAKSRHMEQSLLQFQENNALHNLQPPQPFNPQEMVMRYSTANKHK